MWSCRPVLRVAGQALVPSQAKPDRSGPGWAITFESNLILDRGKKSLARKGFLEPHPDRPQEIAQSLVDSPIEPDNLIC